MHEPRFTNSGELVQHAWKYLADHPSALKLGRDALKQDLPHLGRDSLSRLIKLNPSRIGRVFDHLASAYPHIKPWIVEEGVKPYRYKPKVAIPVFLWYHLQFGTMCMGARTRDTLIYRRRTKA
jgi:hypothetical protein